MNERTMYFIRVVGREMQWPIYSMDIHLCEHIQAYNRPTTWAVLEQHSELEMFTAFTCTKRRSLVCGINNCVGNETCNDVILKNVLALLVLCETKYFKVNEGAYLTNQNLQRDAIADENAQ